MLFFAVVKHAIFLFLFQNIVVAEYHPVLPQKQQEQQENLREKAALLAFKSSLFTLQSQLALANWNETTNVCEFVGVRCNRRRFHVKKLNLRGKSLSGPLSPVLANLTGLRLLDLSNNSLTGHIPREISNLSHLNILDLSLNDLTGHIPQEISSLRQLKELYLSVNQLTGHMPQEISSLRNLTSLDLSFNQLTGHIPQEISSLRNLTSLDLSFNQLTGHIPQEISSLRQLKELYLSVNQLTGHMPQEISSLRNLTSLDLSFNQLTGHILQEISNLSSLVALDLSRNNLTGTIPQSLAYITSLLYLSLASNLLVGQIPDTIFHNCTLLDQVDLSSNALSGQLPSDVGIALTRLTILYLYSNNLTGRLPAWLSNSSSLTQLDVDRNHLSGELPTEVIQGMNHLVYLHLSHNNLTSHDNNTNLEPFFLALSNCSNLEELEMAGLGVGGLLPHRFSREKERLSMFDLQDNMISGPIPPDIANLSNLSLLNLSGNLLNGKIPKEIFQLPKLERFILSKNFLVGSIPWEIGNITSVGLLDLSDNHLSGEIPSSVGDLVHIFYIYLHENQLSGPIPATLGQLKPLLELDLSYNRLTGRIPPEISGIAKVSFRLSNNQLEGPLPLELSKMDQVQEIDLSVNNLNGEIIPRLSACYELMLLSLSHNNLTGQLPAELGGLRNLKNLDVSCNHLEGEIPLSLNNCTNLTFLNVSYNDFSGLIPSGGVFSSFTNFSYLGNPHLCWSVSDRACSRRRGWLHSHKFLVVVAVSASAAAFILTICCVLLVRKMKAMNAAKRGDNLGGSSPVVRSSYPRISYRELVKATEEFNQGRLVGSGSYGHVYRGVLRDGTIVAVKVLNLQTGNSTRSFNRECQVLKRIRHRNLMRIITACSLPDFKALVLPFMANGSLENRLYSGSSSDLSLIQRVNICSDVAEGMAYLHHHSPVKVIHCDLKPSNVLLNDDMTALVSDFGIARLVMTVGVGNTVENVGNSTANMLCGSIGYIAPEYGYGSNASTKGDVYSFGVLLLEVVTRKRPTDEMFAGGMDLHKWVKNHYHGRSEMIIDSSLATAVRHQTPEVKRTWEVAIGELLELGLLCTQASPSLRPTMMDAADDLDRLKMYLSGDTTATFASSFGMSSSTFGETSMSNFDD